MVHLLNGLTYGALLMVLASGLAMMYGLRGVMNLAHGTLYMFGAYLGYTVAGATNFWVALVTVPLLLAIVGLVLERIALRRLAGREVLEVALITLGAALMLEYVALYIWGAVDLSLSPPELLSGSSRLLGTTYPTYRLFVLVAGFAIMAGLALWLQRSRIGLFIRAASLDRETASMLGVNIDRVSLVVVGLATGLAGAAGILAAPYVAINPGMWSEILIPSLVVVVVGGLGSVAGAAIAALGYGLVQTAGATLVPEFSLIAPFVALIAVLALRPTGLAGQRVH